MKRYEDSREQLIESDKQDYLDIVKGIDPNSFSDFKDGYYNALDGTNALLKALSKLKLDNQVLLKEKKLWLKVQALVQTSKLGSYL